MTEIELEAALDRIGEGSTVCFLGAGFSEGATDSNQKPLPKTSKLCDEIKEIAHLPPDKNYSLEHLAEYCEAHDHYRSALQTHLIKRLTFTNTSEAQSNICKAPWRAIFTTDFDDVIQQSIGDTGNYEFITPHSSISILSPDKTPVYYLHGRARDVLDGHTDAALVLSETAYLEMPERNAPLLRAMENELYAASLIVFIGYSLRDTEIAQRLLHIKNLRDKSLIVTQNDDDPLHVVRLQKFGTCLPMGAENFSAHLTSSLKERAVGNGNPSLSFLNKRSPTTSDRSATRADIERLILSGQFDKGLYARQIDDITEQDIYCVRRTRKLDNAFKAIEQGINRLIVSSDLGNGKTVFIEQLLVEAERRGFEIYEITSNLREIFYDVDQIVKHRASAKVIFVIDDISRYYKVAEYIAKRLRGTFVLVVAIRYALSSVDYVRLRDFLGGGNIREIDVNELDDHEVVEWSKFLERWGLWERRIEFTNEERLQFIRNECSGENRSVVVSIFQVSQLREKIGQIVSFFINKNEEHRIAFISVLLNALCHRHVQWIRIVDWLDIDESKFKDALTSSPAANLVTHSRKWYEFSSTELADFIFHHFEFDLEEIVYVYTKVVTETALSSQDRRSGFDAVENLKELMRYRFLTRLFSNRANSDVAINAIYHRLSGVPVIRKNDQFWLQYAIARMEVGDLGTAEKYIETSIGLANKKGPRYSKRQALDQRARLRLRKYSQPNTDLNWAQIFESIEDLSDSIKERGDFVVYPLRASEHLLTFIERWMDDLNNNQIQRVQELVDLMDSSLSDRRLIKSQKGESEKLKKFVADCKLLLANA